MSYKKYTAAQRREILAKVAEVGVYRTMMQTGISANTLYRWRKQNGDGDRTNNDTRDPRVYR